MPDRIYIEKAAQAIRDRWADAALEFGGDEVKVSEALAEAALASQESGERMEHSWVLVSDEDEDEDELCRLCGAQRNRHGPIEERATISGGWPRKFDCEAKDGPEGSYIAVSDLPKIEAQVREELTERVEKAERDQDQAERELADAELMHSRQLKASWDRFREAVLSEEGISAAIMAANKRRELPPESESGPPPAQCSLIAALDKAEELMEESGG